jgi:hypothetical protein
MTLESGYDINERMPLLTAQRPRRRSSVDVLASRLGLTAAAPPPAPDTLGWAPHTLPDGSTYWHHARARITTDADLLRPRVLAHVQEFVGATGAVEPDPADAGALEVWLYDGGRRGEFVPSRMWVDHRARTVAHAPPAPRRAAQGAEDRACTRWPARLRR